MTAQPRLVAVVLAGGVGSRFWPASTPDRPKQVLPLGSDRPLIADAVERAAALAGRENVRVLTGPSLVESLRAAAPGLASEQFMVEPVARSTGPVLAWAALALEREQPGTVMVSLHADHVISPLDRLRQTIDTSLAAVEATDGLVCVGAVPDRPETGYGYIELGERLGDRFWSVARFVEKPGREAAETYVESGRYLWNTGIFVWRARALVAAMRRWTPEIASHLEALERGDVEGFFSAVDPVSVDVGLLERADSVVAVQATFSWDDVGSWNALARARGTDEDGNLVIGDGRAVESSDTIVWSEDGSVAVFGVEGLVVVRSGTRTLVTTREAAPDMKRLLESLGEAVKP